jgi:hypothetical protein
MNPSPSTQKLPSGAKVPDGARPHKRLAGAAPYQAPEKLGMSSQTAWQERLAATATLSRSDAGGTELVEVRALPGVSVTRTII